MFCESLVRQTATPFGIVLVTFDLTMSSTFGVLMKGTFYDSLFEVKIVAFAQFRTTGQRRFLQKSAVTKPRHPEY